MAQRITVRFPEELLLQMDETALELAKMGIHLTQSGMVRFLIERALKDGLIPDISGIELEVSGADGR